MMFNTKTILDAFKSMEIIDAPENLCHTQYLEYCAKLLGYTSYKHFKSYLESPPEDRIGDVHTGLMRKICSMRTPKPDVSHVRLKSYRDMSIGYDSYFIGWDKRGNEVRVPTLGHDRLSITDFRSYFEVPLYVIETSNELLSWQFKWGSFAAVPEGLAREHFPSLFNKKHLVVEDPPIKKIKRKVREDLRRRGLI
ncbi:hypothetical protein [Pseudomonas sp. Irchel 3H7]|uniref:hypothetical protein n=1 Tax=Pseudomonas sp. Irchel 3H7 TaxID=2009042 RepID=UPI000BA44F4E|nr:hypothetical protein [Pseudomonas sp. Irchel 3H7]